MADVKFNIRLNVDGKDQVVSVTSEVKKLSAEVGNVGGSAGKLDILKGKFEQIAASSMPLKRQLAELKKIMGEMQFEGLSGTAQFNEIATYAGRVQDSISDASRAIKAFASDTATLDAMKVGFQGLTGVITMTTGAMHMFGVEDKDVQQAILKVQAAMAMLNGVTAIFNALNKDSALMLKLKSINLLGNTAATTADTISEGANTAATAANTVAQGANTTATEAATVAQLAHNAAVMANPYILAAMAIAAVVGGLVLWASTSDDATDSQIALNAAVDAFNESVDGEMKNAAKQISLYDDLKNQYDNSGKKVDDFAKKLIANKEVQSQLGVVVKTVDDVHRLFANKTSDYTKAALARASAMAAEAAQAAMLGSTLAELTKVYAKLQAGEEVSWKDMRKVVESAGYSSDMADKLMYSAGFRFEGATGMFGDIYGDVVQGSGNLQKLFENIAKGGAIKELSKMAEYFAKTFQKVNEIKFDDILTNNLKSLGGGLKDVEEKTTKAGKTGKDSAKDTKEELDGVLTSLAGCEATISNAEKAMKKLDRTSADYSKKMEDLRKVVLGAKAAKLLLIDNSTLKGVNETRKALQDILNDLPQGSAEADKFKENLAKANKAAYEMAKSLAADGSVSNLNAVKKELDTIIASLPEGSEELEKWVKLWRDVDNKIKSANEHADNLKKGIQEGSVAQLEQQVKKLQDKLKNGDLSAETRLTISANIEDLQAEINEKTKGKLTIEADVAPTFIETGSVDDLRQSYQNAKSKMSQIQSDLELGLINKKQAFAQIDAINDKLRSLGLNPIKVDIQSNIEEVEDNFKGVYSGVKDVSGGITSMIDALNNSENAWDALTGVIDGFIATFDGIRGIIEIIKSITAATQLATAASVAKAAADTAEGQASAGAAVADATKSGAGLPFPYNIAAIAAGVAAVIAALAMMSKFATGGIVGGNSYSGDNVLARVNSGEMILNRTQQKRLFDMINGGALYRGLPTVTQPATSYALDVDRLRSNIANNQGGMVRFEVEGRKLVGVLSNETRITSVSGKRSNIVI